MTWPGVLSPCGLTFTGLVSRRINACRHAASLAPVGVLSPERPFARLERPRLSTLPSQGQRSRPAPSDLLPASYRPVRLFSSTTASGSPRPRLLQCLEPVADSLPIGASLRKTPTPLRGHYTPQDHRAGSSPTSGPTSRSRPSPDDQRPSGFNPRPLDGLFRALSAGCQFGYPEG
jgi:hypothetical protein